MGDAVSNTDLKELNNFLVRGGEAGPDGMMVQQPRGGIPSFDRDEPGW